MSEWIYFIHPPRDDFVATITPEETAIMHTRPGRGERPDDRGAATDAGQLPARPTGDLIGTRSGRLPDTQSSRSS